jgi:hypothetical protein
MFRRYDPRMARTLQDVAYDEAVAIFGRCSLCERTFSADKESDDQGQVVRAFYDASAEHRCENEAS